MCRISGHFSVRFNYRPQILRTRTLQSNEYLPLFQWYVATHLLFPLIKTNSRYVGLFFSLSFCFCFLFLSTLLSFLAVAKVRPTQSNYNFDQFEWTWAHFYVNRYNFDNSSKRRLRWNFHASIKCLPWFLLQFIQSKFYFLFRFIQHLFFIFSLFHCFIFFC